MLPGKGGAVVSGRGAMVVSGALDRGSGGLFLSLGLSLSLPNGNNWGLNFGG